MDSVGGQGLSGLDPVTGTFALPLWVAGALAALFVIVAALAFSRNSSDGTIGALIRYSVVLIGALMIWAFLDRSLVRDEAAEWRALEMRAATMARPARRSKVPARMCCSPPRNPRRRPRHTQPPSSR
jgi:hypothetical protein